MYVPSLYFTVLPEELEAGDDGELDGEADAELPALACGDVLGVVFPVVDTLVPDA